MAELKRGETRTTIRPAPMVSASGTRAVAQGYNDAARMLGQVADRAAADMVEDRNLMEATQQAKLENDAWMEASRLSREFEGQPEKIQPAFEVWSHERVKGLQPVLGNRAEQILPLWSERLRSIGGRTVTRQYEIARQREKQNAAALFDISRQTVRAELGSTLAELAARGGDVEDIEGVTAEHAVVLREYALSLAQQGIITPAAVSQVGVDLNKWAYGEWARNRAVHIRRARGADAAERFIQGLDGSKLAMTPEEIESVGDIARAEAEEAMGINAEAREIALVNFEAEIKKATDVREITAVKVPGGLTSVQQARAKAARDVAVSTMQQRAVEEADAIYAESVETQIVDALAMQRLDMLPSDESVNLLPTKLQAQLLERRQRATVAIMARNEHDRDVARAKEVTAVDAANEAARVQGWLAAIEGGPTAEGAAPPPAPSQVIDMVRDRQMTEAHGNKLLAAYAKKTEDGRWAENATRILTTGDTAITSQDRRDIDKYADRLRLNVSDPAHRDQILAIAGGSGMVPASVKGQFGQYGDKTYEQITEMSALSTQLARFGLWEGQSREQAAWLQINDMINARLPEADVMSVVRQSIKPEDPGTREVKERAVAELSADAGILAGAVEKRLEAGLADATWMSRLTRGLFGGNAPSFNTVSVTASGQSVWFGLGQQQVDVDPRVLTHARIAATAVSAGAPAPLTALQLANGGADRIMSRVGVSAVSRPIGDSPYALTMDPPELHYPEAAGKTDMVLSALAQEALRSMNRNELRDLAKRINVTVPGGIVGENAYGEADFTGTGGMKVLSELVEKKRLFVEPVSVGPDGRPRYAIMIQPDGDVPPERLNYRSAEGRIQSAFSFGSKEVLFAQEQYDKSGMKALKRRLDDFLRAAP